MDIEMLIQLVNGVGFPIFACVALGLFIVWDKKTRREEYNKSEASTNAVLEKLSDAVNNNTLIIQKLIDKIEGGDLK